MKKEIRNPIDSAILLIHCPDSRGIVAAVTEFINKNNGNIIDLDEHVSAENLRQLQERISEELSLFVPEAKIYSFSALLQLLEASERLSELSSRERHRLDGWYEEDVMVGDSRQGYDLFRNDLRDLVKSERSRFLYGGVLSHLQRGGEPCAYDRRMGRYFGIAAVDQIMNGDFGKMVSFRNGKITTVPIKDVVGHLSLVNPKTQYDVDRYNGRRTIISHKKEEKKDAK